MDYMDHADIVIHEDETVFLKNNQAGRLILMTTKAHTAYTNFAFRPNDMIIAGRESAGVPEEFARKCDGLVRIPMRQETRSLNVAISAGMVIGEAMRQTDYQTQASLF
jgi:Predicted rRNA methylase (SpoU class)